MSGDTTPPKQPVAYSSNRNDEGELTGHTVTIAPHQLDASITKFKHQSAHQGPTALIRTLQDAMLTDGDFGKIPDSGYVTNEVTGFIHKHTGVMSDMGHVLDDFVARVQAAAQLGYETDPETRRQAAWAQAHMR